MGNDSAACTQFIDVVIVCHVRHSYIYNAQQINLE